MDTISKKLTSIEKSINAIKGNMATKEDLKTMATKEDLKRLEVRLTEKIEEAQMEIIATVDKHKADKETVNVLEKRVGRLEDNAGLPPYAA